MMWLIIRSYYDVLLRYVAHYSTGRSPIRDSEINEYINFDESDYILNPQVKTRKKYLTVNYRENIL